MIMAENELKSKILPFVLHNAISFSGKVNPKASMGFVLKHLPELRKDAKLVLAAVGGIVESEISGKSVDDLKARLVEVAPDFEAQLNASKKEEVKGPLKPLRGAEKGKLCVRIAPSPSGPLHIGHAYGSLLNFMYAQMYGGEFILRIEDTNPSNIYSPAYDLILDDVKWLTNGKVVNCVVQSERLETYYKYGRDLIDSGDSYVCDCDSDNWREMKAKKAACSCRDLEIVDQQTRWDKMFIPVVDGGYSEGDVVVRLKTDIAHKNPAMRDFSLFRINDHAHPKASGATRVWPLMIMSVAIDDTLLGITHVLNGKDHLDNGRKETLILEKLGLRVPLYQHWGRINFEGFALSTSKTRIAIEQGEYTGWDDIRLATLRTLRRRGYQVGAFSKFAAAIGLSPNDKTVSWDEFWKMVNSFNKEIVEPLANRYFFVEDPVEINVEGMSSHDVSLAMHPDFVDRGNRSFVVGPKLVLASKDFKTLATSRVHRLIDCCNFTVDENGRFLFHSESYDEYREAANRGKILHYLPAGASNVCDLEIMRMGHKIVKGSGEVGLLSCSVGDIVQLEREYFARVDRIDSESGKVWLWELHN